MSMVLEAAQSSFFFIHGDLKRKGIYSVYKARARMKTTWPRWDKREVAMSEFDGGGLHDGSKSKRGKAAMGGRWQNVGGVVCHMPHVCF